MPRFIFTLIAFVVLTNAFGKKRDTTGYYNIYLSEKALCKNAPLIIAGENDSIRLATAWNLYHAMDTLLRMPAARYYPFDSLRQTIVSIVRPADGAFRIFTFNLIATNGDFKQFGYLEVPNGKEMEIFPLLDSAKRPKKDFLDLELETTEWIGALYYGIVPFGSGKKKNYLLLGFDGSNINSNKKVIDVLWFDKGTPVFGKPIFLDGSQDRKAAYRVVYEFHNESQMLLRYEEKRKIVVLDKLTPSFPEAVNDFLYYIPSGDYDYYSFSKKGFWVKEPLENLNLGQGEKPLRPVEKPKPQPIDPPADHN
jgi:hypothetical protein